MTSNLARAVVLVVAGLLLAGCITTKRAATPDHKGWALLSPSSLGQTQTANQVLRMAFGEREATLNCVVSVTAKQVVIICMTALGMRAFTVKYDGTQVSAEAQVGVPQALPPERLLNDLQLVYWPLATLEKALANSPWRVSEPVSGTRRLRHDGRLVTEVHYAGSVTGNVQTDPWQGRIWLSSLEYGYTLSIDSQLLRDEPR